MIRQSAHPSPHFGGEGGLNEVFVPRGFYYIPIQLLERV